MCTRLENTSQVRRYRLKLAPLFLSWMVVVACGNAGTSEKSASDLGPVANIRGSVASQSGNQSDMQGWVVALIEKDSEIARVAEVDSAGLYTLKGVSASRVYTIVLLSPTYIVSSVLSHPGIAANTVRQFFAITSATLPRLIHKGPIVTWQNESGIQVQKDAATDVNADGIPDGIANVIGIELALAGDGGADSDSEHPERGPIGFGLLAAPKSVTDFDKDGIKNILDPDIDADGLVNVFDPDDDGDGLLDIFDQDSDGDLIADSLQTDHDLFFPQGVEWVMVKFEMEPTGDGAFKSSLTFFTKLRDGGPMPTAVQIRGAPHLLADANVEAIAEDGAVVEQAWDRRLLDDGKSEDAAADDLLFGRKIILPADKVPTYHQSVFFQLAFGAGENQWFMEFPYTFAPVTPKAIKSTYEKFSGQVSLSGNPFGDIQDFLWTANIFDAESGLKVYTTEGNTGTVRSVAIPANIFEEGKTYQYDVTAQVLDRVPGYVAYTIKSEAQDLDFE